jgi:hypothetical protein
VLRVGAASPTLKARIFLGRAGTRRALPLFFRAAAFVFALLQFALMAGASWDGARSAAAMR